MTIRQMDLFGTPAPQYPEGFRYQVGLLDANQQGQLVTEIAALPFEEFQFHGYLGKRRVVSFGWKYDFSTENLLPAENIPPFLLPVREVAAKFAGLSPAVLQQVLVTEYSPGAGIGWHKDKAVFGQVVGVSLLSSCNLRLRHKSGSKWERCSLVAEPGSAYLLSGRSRADWEHSVPAVEALRYSLTFRTLRS